MRTPKTLFVLADGARARFVRRGPSGHFNTFDEIDEAAQLQGARGAPQVRSITPGAGQPYASEEADTAGRLKARFISRVAERAAEICRRDGFTRVAVAAPPRLVGKLKDELGESPPLAFALVRDLTKTPDSDLARWLQNPP
jgi:hypothetical protein